MPTTTVKSIGSGGGRDYSTLQSWEDACPANLVTADEIWKGEAYNDSEFTASLSVGGITQDATRYVWLTAAAGQSFQDHASVRTNPLRYDQSKGVGVRRTTGYTTVLDLGSVTRLSRFQAECTTGNSLSVSCSSGAVVTDCILQGNVQGTGSAQTWINDAFTYPAAGQGFGNCQLSILIGCTALFPTDRGTATFFMNVGNYSSPVTLTSCAIFGYTNITDDNTKLSGCSFNVTSSASFPGSNNTTGASFSQFAPFIDADKDSLDLRALTAGALAGAGLLDATNAPNDISGFTRPASPTAGAWQLGAAHVSGADDKRPTFRGFSRGMDRGMSA